MDYHHHARLTIHGRELLCRAVLEGRLRLCEAAAEHGLSRQTAGKWVRRYQAEGAAGLADRSSRPHRLRQPTAPDLVACVETLRRQRWTASRIAQATALSPATVSRILGRKKLSRMRDLEPALAAKRYEWAHPGDMLHMDIKKLGCIGRPSHRVTGNRRDHAKGVGWEYLHVAIDDHSRLAFSTMYPNEKAASVVSFLLQALRYYRLLGIRIRRILTDNGPAYHSRALSRLCRRLGIRHHFTRPYTPRTNGKAERFIKTALNEWAYAKTYQDSLTRKQQLPIWLHQYNWHRPHASLNQLPPIRRSGLDVNNLLTLHT